MSHGSLVYARVTVRQNVNSGEGFLDSHGLHVYLEKLFYVAVNWGHYRLMISTKRFFRKSCAAVRISPNPCPECVFSERHAVRWGAPPCDLFQRATVRVAGGRIPLSLPILAHSESAHSGHHRTTGTPQTPQSGATWATSERMSLQPTGLRTTNQLKLYRKANYNQKGQECTKESLS
jgi:hypothetical protein